MESATAIAIQTTILGALIFFYQTIANHQFSKNLKAFEIGQKAIADTELKKVENELKRKTDSDLELLKSELKKQNDLELEAYKSELKRQSDHDLEEVRHQLSMTAQEHNVIFAKLHEKRCEIIAQVYAAMLKYRRAVSRYIMEYTPKGTAPLKERADEALAAMDDFDKEFFPNEIYFEQETALGIRELEKELWRIMSEYKVFVEDGTNQVEKIDEWKRIGESMRKDVPPLFEKIHQDFQSMIGVFPKKPKQG